MSSVDPLSLVNQCLPPLRVTADEARQAAIEPGYLSAMLMRYGSMELRWYEPQGTDPQQPHDRDELYIVVSGHGVFMRAEERVPFVEDETMVLGGVQRVPVHPGDALFVPAGTEHRFESISDDYRRCRPGHAAFPTPPPRTAAKRRSSPGRLNLAL